MPHAPSDPAGTADALDPTDPVEQLLGECLARDEAEWEAALARTCKAHPQHAATLRRRFALLCGAGLAPSDGTDRERDLAVVRDLAAQEPEVAHALADAMGIDHTSVPGLGERRDPRLDTTLRGRYRLDARLGAGAMGVVYTAHDLELRRDVAVKILDGSLHGSPKAEARFLQEAELLAALRHDAIVAVHDRGLGQDGELFLVMELLDGVPLTHVLDELAQADSRAPLDAVRDLLGGTPPPEPSVDRLAARWAAEVAEGLAAAHAAGILHRDVKPSNVFIRRDWRAVLLDFGIATRGADLTAAGTVLGTPCYMAPEQAIAGARLTPALDVYGLGACLYHLLTRRPPFEGEPLAVVAKIAREDPPRPGTLRPDLPRDLSAILETAMARAVADRYRDAQALALDLRAFLAHQPVAARPLSALGRAWRRARHRPARAALAVAIAIAATLAIVMVPLAARDRAHARAAQKLAIEARLPALLAFEGDPEQRLLEAVRPENETYLADLDALVALDPDDIPTRLWRAALRLDGGDHAGAAADLDRLAKAETASTPYLRAVAARYATAARERRGTDAVDLDDLGVEPVSPADCFVAGFHELRNRHVQGFALRADALLERAAPHYLPARDLRLIALVARGDFERNAGCSERAIAESLRLEGVYGRATARTCAMRGAALVLLGRYADAIAPLEESLRLRPDRHGPLQNLGIAYRRLNDLTKADEYLARAGAVRPHFWNTLYTRAQILKDRGDFAGAWAVAEGLGETGAAGAAWKKPYLLANIAVQELCALYRSKAKAGELEAVAARAIEQFDRTAVRASASLQPRIAATKALAHALTAGNPDEACERLLAQLASDPQDPFQIGNVASLLPTEGLSGRATTYLRLYLAALAAKLAPQDTRQQEYLRDAIAAVDRLQQVTSESPPSGTGR